MPWPESGKSPSTRARVTVVEIPRPGRSRWKARKSETWQPCRSSICTYSPAASSYAFASAGPTRAWARGTCLDWTAIALRVPPSEPERRSVEQGDRVLPPPEGADRRVDGPLRLLGPHRGHRHAGGESGRARDGRPDGLHHAPQGRHRGRGSAGLRKHDRHP